jgi:predicted TIM-barrel fold metal-dependent hydrolase
MHLFDAHFHIIDPRFPLVPNQGFIPEPFSVEDYLDSCYDLQLIGGTVVSGSFQAFHQEYLYDALDKLGESFFGVANIPHDLPEKQIQRLDLAGVKAVRFNLKRGGYEMVKHMQSLSKMLFEDFGWHAELYLDSKDISELASVLNELPAYSIDHLGLSQAGLNELYGLVQNGARVKATGFGRLDFNPVPVMKKIMGINPEALMFGTDMPSTRAKVPFSMDDIELVKQHFSFSDQERIFYTNALQWYRG